MWGRIVCGVNIFCAVLELFEAMFLLWRQLPHLICNSGNCCHSGNTSICNSTWINDADFITQYFLHKEYTHVDFKSCLVHCRDRISRLDLFIDVGIINKLFIPNENNKTLCTLVLGQTGMGKTLLIEKIKSDWAHRYEEEAFYQEKIIFCFKIPSFNDLKEVTFREFLHYGFTGWQGKVFDSVLEEIRDDPAKALFIFDDLNKFTGNFNYHMESSQFVPNDTAVDDKKGKKMPAINFFMKLLLGDILHGTRVLVTSRPTSGGYLQAKTLFDQTVKIQDFTHHNIEELVDKFDKDNKLTIWDYIRDSEELLDVCAIPLICFHVCQTLCNHQYSKRNTISILTKAITEVLNHIKKELCIEDDQDSFRAKLQNLQKLAFTGIENGYLEFDQNMPEEKAIKFGLVSTLSNLNALQPKFIHPSIQKFLAAKHVKETFSAEEINSFVSQKSKNTEWNLVCQFIKQLNSVNHDYHGGKTGSIESKETLV